MRIAVDALGGDKAPEEIVKGAVAAASKYREHTVLLVGPEDTVKAQLDRIGDVPDNIRIKHAPEVVGMHESPMEALRSKPKSSIIVATEMHAAGEVDAFVSAGNTGVVAAAASLKLKRVEGVRRPGLAVPMRAIHSVCVGIDMGTNIQAKAEHLHQYGIMASVFASLILKIRNPRVGLLNIGEEESKGTKLVRDTYRLLAKSKLNFIGNIEGRDIYTGKCDICVCDGFVGNVVLKASEGLLTAAMGKFKELVEQDPEARKGFALCKAAFDNLRNMGDFSEYGGAPLLGVEGATIICHGRSEAKAIENAVKEAKQFVELNINRAMTEALSLDGLPQPA